MNFTPLWAYALLTRMHSSRIHITHFLWGRGVCPRGSAQRVSTLGDVCPGVSATPPWTYRRGCLPGVCGRTPLPRGQKEWHMPVKTLPCPKLRLHPPTGKGDAKTPLWRLLAPNSLFVKLSEHSFWLIIRDAWKCQYKAVFADLTNSARNSYSCKI